MDRRYVDFDDFRWNGDVEKSAFVERVSSATSAIVFALTFIIALGGAGFGLGSLFNPAVAFLGLWGGGVTGLLAPVLIKSDRFFEDFGTKELAAGETLTPADRLGIVLRKRGLDLLDFCDHLGDRVGYVAYKAEGFLGFVKPAKKGPYEKEAVLHEREDAAYGRAFPSEGMPGEAPARNTGPRPASTGAEIDSVKPPATGREQGRPGPQ